MLAGHIGSKYYCNMLSLTPIKEKLANRNSRPLTAEMYENYPGFRAGSSLRCFPKSLPRWLCLTVELISDNFL